MLNLRSKRIFSERFCNAEIHCVKRTLTGGGSCTALTFSSLGSGLVISEGGRLLLRPPDPAQLRGFVGIGVEEAQATRYGGGAAGVAALGLAFAARTRIHRTPLPPLDVHADDSVANRGRLVHQSWLHHLGRSRRGGKSIRTCEG